METTGTSETLSRLLGRGAGLAVVDNPTDVFGKMQSLARETSKHEITYPL